MLTRHWLMIIVVAVAFYYVGAKYPGMIARIGM